MRFVAEALVKHLSLKDLVGTLSKLEDPRDSGRVLGLGLEVNYLIEALERVPGERLSSGHDRRFRK